MLKSFRQLLIQNAGSLPAASAPPMVPLRRTTLPLHQLKPGNAIMFSESCPLPQLRARKCPVQSVRTYRFGQETVKSYQFTADGTQPFSLAIAEDADGHYLAISRQLNGPEQDQWFGRDALSFFTEPSTAKTIRCKADRVIEGAWMGERYGKIVDWVEGALVNGKSESAFHYNLLVNDTGEKALEIEHYDAVGHTNVFVTVYRPVEDILTIAEAIPQIPVPELRRPEPAREPVSARMAPRPDFRRMSEEQIHIAPTPVPEPEPELAAPAVPAVEETPLPSFLLSRSNEQYLSLDEVIPPETERVRVSTRAAKALIDVSLERGVRVRDVLRELLGLESALSDDVIFELPLTERDYRMLAQRYKLRPDHTDEIRARLQDDLRKKLLS